MYLENLRPHYALSVQLSALNWHSKQDKEILSKYVEEIKALKDEKPK